MINISPEFHTLSLFSKLSPVEEPLKQFLNSVGKVAMKMCTRQVKPTAGSAVQVRLHCCREYYVCACKSTNNERKNKTFLMSFEGISGTFFFAAFLNFKMLMSLVHRFSHNPQNFPAETWLASTDFSDSVEKLKTSCIALVTRRTSSEFPGLSTGHSPSPFISSFILYVFLRRCWNM